MSLIELKSVTKVYRTGEVPVTALKEINLEIGTRAFVSFIGPSGSGKTTLLNLMGVPDKPTEGRLLINDVDIGTLDRAKAAEFRANTLGFVFQNFNLIPVLTVYENVEYPLLLVKRVPAKERRDRILTLLEQVGMIERTSIQTKSREDRSNAWRLPAPSSQTRRWFLRTSRQRISIMPPPSKS